MAFRGAYGHVKSSWMCLNKTVTRRFLAPIVARNDVVSELDELAQYFKHTQIVWVHFRIWAGLESGADLSFRAIHNPENKDYSVYNESPMCHSRML
jgi:hypothetical protein